MSRRLRVSYTSLFALIGVLNTSAFAKQANVQTVEGSVTRPQSKMITKGFAQSFTSDAKSLLPELSAQNKAAHVEFKKVRTTNSKLGTHHVYRQVLRGVPVYGTEASVHLSAAGKPIATSQAMFSELNDVDMDASITKEAAIASLKTEGKIHKAELFVVVSNDIPTLAWRVVQVHPDGKSWEYFVDANDASSLSAPRNLDKFDDEQAPVKSKAKIFNVNAIVATKDNTLKDMNGASSAVPATAYEVVDLLGLTDARHINGTYASSANNLKQVPPDASGNYMFTRGTPGFGEAMAYYYIDGAQRFIQSLGFQNVNNRKVMFAVDKLADDNSFYSPSTKEISFGMGGVDDSEDAEVILHELGHAIQDDQVPDWGESMEAGAMGEGFGDFFAASVLSTRSGGFQDDCVADWDAATYSPNNPPCLRRMDSKKKYPADLGGEVHDDGEIWSATLWDLKPILGREEAVKLVLQSHFLLNPYASMNDGAQALYTSAVQLNFTADNITKIEASLTARGYTIAK